MKRIALLASGIPNFKFTINNFFHRIIFPGHEVEYDIYFCFWKKYHKKDKIGFVNSQDDFDYEKFSTILPKNFNLKKVIFIDEPNFLSKELIKNPHLLGKIYEKINIYGTDQLSKTLDLIDSCLKQFLGLKYVFDLSTLSNINYDCYMKFRIDGITNYSIDFNYYYEWVDNTILMPSNGRYCLDKPNIPVNDQLAITNFYGMKVFCSLVDFIEKYVLEDDLFFHQETLLSYHLFKNEITVGDMCLDHHLIRD